MNWRRCGYDLRVIYGNVLASAWRDWEKALKTLKVILYHCRGSSSAPLTYKSGTKVVPRRKLETDYVSTTPRARIETFLHAFKILTSNDSGTCDFFFCIMFLQWLVTAFTSPFLAPHCHFLLSRTLRHVHLARILEADLNRIQMRYRRLWKYLNSFKTLWFCLKYHKA